MVALTDYHNGSLKNMHFRNIEISSWVSWTTHIIPVLERQKEDFFEYEDSLVYI